VRIVVGPVKQVVYAVPFGDSAEEATHSVCMLACKKYLYGLQNYKKISNCPPLLPIFFEKKYDLLRNVNSQAA
jgi:hypothetical protein